MPRPHKNTKASRAYSSIGMNSVNYWDAAGFTGTIARAALRTLQFSFAVVVAALYGVDLARSSRENASADTSFVYAEVASALSIITCIIHCLVTIKRVAWVVWDLVLCVLWAAQFGTLGSRYLTSEAFEPRNRDATGSFGRMRAGVWIGMICMLLWGTTFLQGTIWCCANRRITRRTSVVDHSAHEQSLGVSADAIEGEPSRKKWTLRI